MRVYFDPSFLIALYLPEPASMGARGLVDRLAQPILVNELQEFEFKNGIRQKVVRKEITEADLARSLRVFQDDCVLNKIQRKPVACLGECVRSGRETLTPAGGEEGLSRL